MIPFVVLLVVFLSLGANQVTSRNFKELSKCYVTSYSVNCPHVAKLSANALKCEWQLVVR